MLQVARTIALFSAAAALAPTAVTAQPAAPAQAAAAPGAAAAQTVPPPTPDAPAADLAKKFDAAVKCDGRKDPLRHFCAISRVGKDFIWTPGQPTSYIGLSVTIKTGADLKKALAAPTTAVLHLGPASAKVAAVTGPALPDADRATVQTGLAKFLATDAKEPTAAPAALADALRAAVHEGRAPLKLLAENRGFAELSTGAAPTRLYRSDAPSGSVFVTVEPTADGQVVSVFPAQTGIN